VTSDVGSVARYLAGHPAFADLPPVDLRCLADEILREAGEIRKASAVPEQAWAVAGAPCPPDPCTRPKALVVVDPATWRQSQWQAQ
jgi:hypothetical protein